MGPPVGGDGADITPVAAHPVLDRLARLDQAGEQAMAEVLELAVAGGQLLEGGQQRPGLEGEHLGGHPGRRRLLRLGGKPLRRPSSATSTTACRDASASSETSEVTTVTAAPRSRWRVSTSP
jgi:hypothetical protein